MERQEMNYKDLDPYEGINFMERRAFIKDKNGKVIFDEIAEFPDFFSEKSVNIVSSKYLCNEAKRKETSIKQMIDRVSDTISNWGLKDGYFGNDFDDNKKYYEFLYKLKYYQINQYFTFNSPVYFNCGLSDKPQNSACQPGWSLINTELGHIPIEEIVKKNMIGLNVFDENGKTKIIAIKSNGDKEVIRVETNEGSFIEVTGDHQVFIKDNSKIIPIRAENLKEGMRLVTNYDYILEDGRFSTMESISKAAVVGWLQTDGFVGKYNNESSKSWIIEFCTINEEERTWLNPHIKKTFPEYHFNTILEDTKDPEIEFVRYRAYGLKFEDFILDNILHKRKQFKEVPLWIFNSEIEIVRAYLRSIFQADGYVNILRNSCIIKLGSVSKKFVNGIQLLLTRFGIFSRQKEYIDPRENRLPSYTISIGYKNDRIKFMNEIGFISNKKVNNLKKSLKLKGKISKSIRNPKIKNIEKIGIFPVYDIQTESGKYLSNNTLIHNCFILDIEDDMESIYESMKLESSIFKHGSGSGMNMSKLRSRKEKVHEGGLASGPTSFLKPADTSAGVIKSGGALRRSAKLVCLNIDHPDVLEFIHCKEREEKKLRILKKAGFKQMDGYELSDEVFFQNTNLSLTVPDDFMNSVERDESWWTKYVLTGERCEKFEARGLLRKISELAWRTGDPGFQFSDTINRWNTCKSSGSIVSTNPCGEFAWLNNSSCNLAAVNLLKFFVIKDGEASFDYEKYEDVVRTVIMAQDMLVNHSAYPSRKISSNTHNFRPLGLGYSNLGSLLMCLGLPYDSEEGRNIAALLTALLTGIAFKTSNELAKNIGTFVKFDENKESFYEVLENHKECMYKLLGHSISVFSKNEDLVNKLAGYVRDIGRDFESMLENKEGFRNAQVTLLAPTGTTSFMMDCSTKGIEPEYSLISYKTLSGNDGATIKMINQLVRESLENLGYNKEEVEDLCNELHSLRHFENSEILKPEHLPIFDTANTPEGGNRHIDYIGHVKMVAAVQPFLSGAISKTINMPKSATVDEIYNLFIEAWKMGLKGVTIYRDKSKEEQPLNTSESSKTDHEECIAGAPCKRKLPATRPGEVHKFSIGTTEGYLMTGEFDGKELGETFLTVAKQGSTLSGLLDMLAIMISISLQHGVPLKIIVSKLMFSRFDPSGITSNPDIRFATSICDYLGRYLGNKYLSDEDKLEIGLKKQDDRNDGLEEFEEISIINSIIDNGDAPVCDCCGGMMQRVGTCFNCNNCGANSGACG